MKTQNKLKRFVVFLAGALLVFGTSCEDDNNETSMAVPSVETKEIVNIGSTDAEGGGEVLEEGSSEVLERGIVWSTEGEPTYNDNEGMSFNGEGLGEFTSELSELQSGVPYLVRAFAHNSEGVGYGDVVEFTTIMEFLTESVTEVTSASAVSGGNIPQGMTGPINERGVVWDTSDNPTIEENMGQTSDGSGHGSYVSQITGLEPGVDYFVRAYATNDEGTEYGNIKEFTTELYEPIYEGETFYMPFNNSFIEMVSGTEPAVVGSPTFSEESANGSHAYQGAPDSYLTFSTTDLLANEFSAAFWYKSEGEPGWAGIMTIGPPDEDHPDYPEVQNDRTSGFRFFREGAPSSSVFKMDIGFGDYDVFYANETEALLDLTKDEWVHIAFSISETEVAVYFNGEPVIQGEMDGTIDWTNCDIISIGSGQPRFTEWQHYADHSLYDELRLFNVALSQADVMLLMEEGQN
ncbi:LamG domain-containing protein [Marinilabilia salmonicolor]|uniref:LamG domain-containing protein n=1 Tax=Marinilabilia salmonicolor TaxID=989 RepID=UPI00029AB62A|nr:LamG domain-containing protein [Marinilabilia salmonicolor]